MPPSLSDLPELPEHVIFAIGDQRIEAALDELIALGIKACTIFSSLILKEDTAPLLKQRIQTKAEKAGLLVAGANAMGFYNVRDQVLAGGFDTREHRYPGNVALISQSGAGMSGIVDCEQRIDFNFALSSGYELTVAMEDYLDYVLDLPETRVVGLFLETSRYPQPAARSRGVFHFQKLRSCAPKITIIGPNLLHERGLLTQRLHGRRKSGRRTPRPRRGAV